MGRVRDEKLRDHIMKTAYQLLGSHDFHKISLNSIAQAAGVSPSTMYRWWGSQDMVLFDAVTEHVYPILPIPDKPRSPLRRYRSYFANVADFLNSPDGEVFKNFFVGMRCDRRLHKIYLERYWALRYKIQVAMIEAAQVEHELRSDINADVIIDAINGPMFFAWVNGHRQLTRQYALRMFDQVIQLFIVYPQLAGK